MVSFTGQLSLAILVCVCVGRQPISIIQEAVILLSWHVQGHLLLFIFPPLVSSSVRGEGRGNFGEMHYWGYG